jgi:hypothetical protein
MTFSSLATFAEVAGVASWTKSPRPFPSTGGGQPEKHKARCETGLTLPASLLMGSHICALRDHLAPVGRLVRGSARLGMHENRRMAADGPQGSGRRIDPAVQHGDFQFNAASCRAFCGGRGQQSTRPGRLRRFRASSAAKSCCPSD